MSQSRFPGEREVFLPLAVVLWCLSFEIAKSSAMPSRVIRYHSINKRIILRVENFNVGEC